MTEPMPLLLRIDDISALLQIPRRSLQRLRLQGKFPEPTTTVGRFPTWNREIITKFANGEWKPRPTRKSATK
jgi:hypothetical protein